MAGPVTIPAVEELANRFPAGIDVAGLERFGAQPDQLGLCFPLGAFEGMVAGLALAGDRVGAEVEFQLP